MTEWTRQQIAVADGDRGSLNYWLRKAIESGWRGDDILMSALNRMAIRGIPVRASDADGVLGQTDGTTQFFNHGGTVPAEDVVDELMRRLNPSRPHPVADATDI